MKILFFIDSLCSGGRERRLVELLFYLKQNTDYDIKLILTEHDIHYSYIHDLNIPIDIIKRCGLKKDPLLFFRFYRIAKHFKPDIIHTWGTMSTFYAVPTNLLLKKILFANLISDAKNKNSKYSIQNFFYRTAVKYTDVILGNSIAGFKAYSLDANPKMHLIYNGVRLNRFNLDINIDTIKRKLNITTKHVVIMVASTSNHKDYDLFLDVAKVIANKYNNITFIGVGGGRELKRLKTRVQAEHIYNTMLLGKRNDVEKLISIADIGLLLTNKEKHAEGISNSIIEYMAMGRPVITTDTVGGSGEIIENGESGYIMQASADPISNKIIELINKPNLRKQLGSKGKQIIKQKFSIERMGSEYVELYEKTLNNKE